VARISVKEHFGQAGRLGTEVRADQLDLTQGQSGSGNHLVDARLREGLVGLVADAGHDSA
jgi:hypothetical protein